MRNGYPYVHVQIGQNLFLVPFRWIIFAVHFNIVKHAGLEQFESPVRSAVQSRKAVQQAMMTGAFKANRKTVAVLSFSFISGDRIMINRQGWIFEPEGAR